MCFKSKQQEISFKSNRNLFSDLYRASKYRDDDLEDLFGHENHPWPPSLSDHGKLCLPIKKSDLLSLLGGDTSTKPSYNFDCKVLDGAAVVHMLSTKQFRTFFEYGDNVFLLWIEQQLLN